MLIIPRPKNRHGCKTFNTMRSKAKHKEPNDLTPSSFFEKEGNLSFFEKGGRSFFNTATQPKAPVIQRKCAECEKEEVQAKSDGTVQRQETAAFAGESSMSESSMSEGASAPVTEAATDTMTPEQPLQAGPTRSGRMIADDAEVPQPGQMTRSDFLGTMQQQVTATATEELSGTPYASGISSYVQTTFGRYYGYSASQLEDTIRRQEPSAGAAQNAAHMIQIINARVRSEIRSRIPSVGSVVGDVASAAGDAVSGIGSSIGSLLFKENSGGAKAAQSPSTVMRTLGKGTKLDGGSRAKMESVFGTSFSNVEVHTDSKAAQLSGGMNARAFTVGNHIAFAQGEHKPGTFIGDALMAHELAHVMQQDGSRQIDAGNAMQYAQLEEDADNSAVNAVLTSQGIKGGIKNIGKKMMPRLKSGLRLQRCLTTSSGTPVRVRYRQYGGTGFSEGSCPAYCACLNDPTGARVTAGDARHVPPRSIAPGGAPCPPGLEVVWDGSRIVSEVPLATDPCPMGPMRSGCL